jgi:polysaccharide pyruvyl transferase WcaK-like protein
VGLAYSRKFFGVFESVGMDKLVIDLREHDEKSVVEAVERAFQSRSELRNRLEATIPAVKASVLKLFGQISMDSI